MPTYVPRCVEVLDDEALILVTTQQAHVAPDGAVESADYDCTRMRSARPVERFTEMLRLLNESHLLLDPLYGMMRRDPVAGPFGHVCEVLSYRRFKPFQRLPATARRLGVPPWQANVATTLQCRELLAAVREANLRPDDRREARAAVARMFVRRKRVTATHRTRKLAGLVSHAVARPPGLASTSPKGR
jgi:hypothetical protein